MPPSVKRSVVPVFLLIGALAVGAFLPYRRGTIAAPIPRAKEPPPSGLLVLAHRSEQPGNVPSQHDLHGLDASGKVVLTVPGFNTHPQIGNYPLIALDAKRSWVWVVEGGLSRIRKFDRKGKELLAFKHEEVICVAVDPETGNLWALTTNWSRFAQRTVVYDPKGNEVARYDIKGYTIAYDPTAKGFWLAGDQRLIRVIAATGRVEVETTLKGWATSLAVHPKSGKVWVATRGFPQDENWLLGYDNDGKLKHSVLFTDKTPFHVSTNPRSGAVWLTLLHHSVRRYSPEGKLKAEHKLGALAALADLTSDDVWVVTKKEILRLAPEGKILKDISLRGELAAAWVAGW